MTWSPGHNNGQARDRKQYVEYGFTLYSACGNLRLNWCYHVLERFVSFAEKLWAPIIMEPMSDKTLTEYDELSLICAISAKPLPTITWSVV